MLFKDKNRYDFATILLYVAICINFAIGMMGLSGSLFTLYEFRQTQTAVSALFMARERLSINYPTPIVGAPWQVPMEFPLYQWIVVLLHKATHLNLDATGRLVSLVFFYGSLFYLFRITRLLTHSKQVAQYSAILILLSPYYLYWGRAFLIETTALFLALAFIYLAVKWRKSKSLWKYGLLLMLSVLAILTKVTMFISLLLLAFFLALPYLKRFTKPVWIWAGIMLVILIIDYAALKAWTIHADGIKAENPFALQWCSYNLTKWNFGTLAARLALHNWMDIFKTVGFYSIFIVGMYGVLTIWLYKHKRLRYGLLVFIAMYLVGPMIFFNLFVIHTYYSTGSVIFLLTAMGMIHAYVTRYKNAVAGKILLIAIIGFFMYRYQRLYYAPQAVATIAAKNPYKPLADRVKNTSRPDDFYIVQYGWLNSNISYYTERKTLNIDGSIDSCSEMIRSRNDITKLKGIIQIIQGDIGKPQDTIMLNGIGVFKNNMAVRIADNRTVYLYDKL